jgi:hypothetical protein
MRKEALFGTQPGAVVAGRHEAVSALSGVMRDNIEETFQNLNAAQAAQAAIAATPGATAAQVAQAQQDMAQAQEQFDRELAAVAGRYDAMGQISPQNASIMANNVMSQVIPGAPVDPNTGTPQTVQQMIEGARGRQGFLEMRREYMAAQMQGANAQLAAAAAGAIPPPGTPAGGGPGGP